MDALVDSARKAGWAVAGSPPFGVRPGEVVVLTRGPERIEIEISNGGIPHKVTRTLPDGTTSTLGQTYFTMSEVAGWLAEPRSRPRKGPDERQPQ